MSNESEPYQEGKRAGLHPAIVVFGVIIGMWLLIALAVPSGKQKQATARKFHRSPRRTRIRRR